MNTRRADHRADIYSLGCTLYFLLTGQPLYDGETVMERVLAHREHPVRSLRKACPAVPQWLDGVFRKLVAKRPDDRYQTVTEVISALERHTAPQRKRGLKVAAAVAVLLVLTGLPFVFQGRTTPEKPDGKAEAEHATVGPKTDLEAALITGKRLCFVENNWAEGLPLLAKGDDDCLRQLAMADLRDSTSPQEQMRLGDRWWDFAGNEIGAVWKGSQRRAAFWYRKVTSVPRPRRAEIEKRLKDLDEQPPGFEVFARRAEVFPDDTHGFARSTNLILEVSKNEATSPAGGFAGVELKGVRFLNIAVTRCVSGLHLSAGNA